MNKAKSINYDVKFMKDLGFV